METIGTVGCKTRQKSDAEACENKESDEVPEKAKSFLKIQQLPSAGIMKHLKKFLCTTPAIFLLLGQVPAKAMNVSSCTAMQGQSLAAIKSKLGQGKMVSSSAATQYVPAFQMYYFGNAAQGGACSVMIQNGRVQSATYVNF